MAKMASVSAENQKRRNGGSDKIVKSSKYQQLVKKYQRSVISMAKNARQRRWHQHHGAIVCKRRSEKRDITHDITGTRGIS